MKPSTTIEFLDALKERHHLKSDYALAPTASGTAQKRRDSVYYVKPRPRTRPRTEIVVPRGSPAVFATPESPRHKKRALSRPNDNQRRGSLGRQEVLSLA